jgi:thiosulfate reductase cytochrome b subunit
MEPEMKPEVELRVRHPLALRWFHWLNFPLLATMIWSGLLIYWANDIYEIKLFGHTYFHFFPDWFYKGLHIDGRLAEGLGWHFLFMWFFTINGIAYVLFLAFSGQWRHVLPRKGSFKEAILVTLHDLYIIKKHPKVDGYNGAQRLAYTGIVAAGLGSIVTGFAIYKPARLQWLANLLGGYEFARILHFLLMLGFLMFFVVHIIQVARAGWNNFRGMVTGRELVKKEEAA